MTSIPVDMKAGSPTMRRALPQSLVAWLFLAPAAFIFAVVLIYPMTYSAWLSLFQWDGVSPRQSLGGVRELRRAVHGQPGILDRVEEQCVLESALARHPDRNRPRPCPAPQHGVPGKFVFPERLLLSGDPVDEHRRPDLELDVSSDARSHQSVPRCHWASWIGE